VTTFKINMDGYSIATHMQKACHIVLFMLHCATIFFLLHSKYLSISYSKNTSIQTFDFSTLYPTIPQDNLKLVYKDSFAAQFTLKGMNHVHATT
jgi:hypothetical protein